MGLVTKVAWALGYLINPMILPPALFWWLTAGLGWEPDAVLAAVLLVAFFLGLVPISLVGWLVYRGKAETVEVRDQHKRLPAFIAAFLSGVTAILVAALMDWPVAGVLWPLLAIFPLNTAILAAINTRTKISIHVSSLTGFTSMSFWLALRVGLSTALPIGAILATPVLMWARVRAKAHSEREVIYGAFFGFLMPIAELYLLTAVGWLRFS
jgi:hypothetical protein